ncbi:hypothetical protein HOLleu_08651 [Holothuria leucospilota]|uniref:Uncharacterized protein n=1 Tax=Holothuria leucospilota TaxID=206669 RepID=A0A9Q1HDM1_HOLLE|nr:hypothetical protein HOLleu_08651 [Holothuria leucospilota]
MYKLQRHAYACYDIQGIILCIGFSLTDTAFERLSNRSFTLPKLAFSDSPKITTDLPPKELGSVIVSKKVCTQQKNES